MLNQSASLQRAQPPPRSSSLRAGQSVAVSGGSAHAQPVPKAASTGHEESDGAGTSSRIAVELQRLHELKRQVLAYIHAYKCI